MRWSTAFSPPLLGEGAANVQLALRRMKNALAILHVTAHPDDEDAHTLTTLARAEGYRVGIFSLTRGESGENTRDHRAFESLGAMRTDELLRAASWYGVEDVYFGPFYDYGFSKKIEEAFKKWGQENLVREIVRAIRAFQPDVVLGRFRGEACDGHAHHQAVGWAAREAFRLAPNPSAFPELGFEPTKPAAYFVFDEPSHKRCSSSLWEAVNSAAMLTPLGVSCAQIAELGYAEHLSQTGGKQVVPRAKRQLYRCLSRHKPHLGDARFGFRQSEALGITDVSARTRYEQALCVIETQLQAAQLQAVGHMHSKPQEARIEPALEVLFDLAPNDVMRSRADDLDIALKGLARTVHAYDETREEPKAFFGAFPTVRRYASEFSLDVERDEVDQLHVHGTASVQAQGAIRVRFTDDPPLSLERNGNDAVYQGAPPLLPHMPPSCIVQVRSNSLARPVLPVVARSQEPPHEFEVMRRSARLPKSKDARIAGAPPPSVIGSVTRHIWYVPGEAECYGDALRALGAPFTECKGSAFATRSNDTLLIGFRAYHKHASLSDASARIHDAVRDGTRVVVMAQTPEYDPRRDAPYVGELRGDAPEACEEHQRSSFVDLSHPLLHDPHPLTQRDLDDWHEQYGSKFWSTWSRNYAPLVECADRDEPAQRGVLLSATYGKGRYTYCALALHLQLIHGHAGAYRLFANLLQT